MKLWLISQSENRKWDTYDSAVVAAESEVQARAMHPSGDMDAWLDYWPTWCELPDEVTVRYIGDAAPGTPAGVICASFNAS